MADGIFAKARKAVENNPDSEGDVGYRRASKANPNPTPIPTITRIEYRDAPPQQAPAPQAPQAPQQEVAPQGTTRPPVVLSERAARAVAGTKAYENVMLPRQGDYTIRNDQSVVSDFDDAFKLNLARAEAPQPQEPKILQNAEAQATQNQVMNYANNYKKAVADTLVPDQNFF